MNIEIKAAAYNEMMDFAKGIIDIKINKHKWQSIKISYLSMNTITAEVISANKSGKMIIKTESNITNFEPFYMRTTRKLKKDIDNIIIKLNDDGVIVKFGDGIYCYDIVEDYFPNNLDNFYPEEEPKEVFTYDPKLLVSVLNGFKDNNSVQVEYHGEFKPLIFRTENKKALVMPMQPKNKMDRW